ncbi:exported hypothetical protein [Candidatus Sulfopaludibacter sp. SbA4]|nr:exported hypothetical protein [Candidatus Sulfopaludibacter sp. SbA4]
MKLIGSLLFLTALGSAQSNPELASPNGQLKIAFQTLTPPPPTPGGRGGGRGAAAAPAGAQLMYSVAFHGSRRRAPARRRRENRDRHAFQRRRNLQTHCGPRLDRPQSLQRAGPGP